MHDWNNYRNQLVAASTGFGKLSPDTVRGYGILGGAGEKTGHLDAKTRELMALAVAVSLRCDALVYSMRTLDAFDTTTEEQATA
jgi:alkylhydroperoxidase/carboxymuconolactone decarboxylase family protein YurZ